MLGKRVLEWGFYVGLLVPALVFVFNYVEEYLEGNTFFVETTKPITLNDLPVTTICFGYPDDTYWNELTEEQRIGLENGEYLQNLYVVVHVLEHSELLRPRIDQPLTMENNTLPVPGGEWILKQLWVTPIHRAMLILGAKRLFALCFYFKKLQFSLSVRVTVFCAFLVYALFGNF